jgi:hypothetical protein
VTCQANNHCLHDCIFRRNVIASGGWTEKGAKFGLTAAPEVVGSPEATGFELSLCLTLRMTRRAGFGGSRS